MQAERVSVPHRMLQSIETIPLDELGFACQRNFKFYRLK
jgi:hypothetical protein